MSKNRFWLIVIGTASGLATVMGWAIYLAKGDVSDVSWPFIWLGLFTWDDGMILGLFLLLGCLVLWRKGKPALTSLFFSAYALVRSLIEVFYGLNAQFSPVTRPWESNLPSLAAYFHLKLPELFVFYQIFFTAICVVALVFFLTFIRRYLRAAR